MKESGSKLIQEIRELRKTSSYKEISKKLGIPKSTAYNYSKDVKQDIVTAERLLKKSNENRSKFSNRFANEKKIKNIKKLTPILIRIISHCLFDGSVSKSGSNSYKIGYTNSSKKCMDNFISDMKNVFGLEPSGFYKVDGKNCRYWDVRFTSKKATLKLKEYIKSYSTSDPKCEIGNWIFEIPESYKKEFTNAFWDDEGYINAAGKIYGKSKSKKIIKQLIKLHKSVGIDCTLSVDNVSKNYTIYIRKEPDNIRLFSSFGFKYGTITRGINTGKTKSEIFLEYYKAQLK